MEWDAAALQLRRSEPGEDTDELIDSLTESIFAGNVGLEATACMVEATRLAQSDLSLRSAALAAAVVADPGDNSATDALVGTYQRIVNHPFLAPVLLEALGLLALKSPLALAELSGILLRLNPNHQRYVLVKAAQVLGRLDAVQRDENLRAKLSELITSEDPAVQAEARYQLALAQLADVLLSENKNKLRVNLIAARVAFARAEASEEQRTDAIILVHLLDMLLAFLTVSDSVDTTSQQVENLTAKLHHILNQHVPHVWQYYTSSQVGLLINRVLRISDALHRGAEASTEADDWTDFGVALEQLAYLYAQIRGDSTTIPEPRVTVGLGQISDTIFAASLGPLLARVVNQRRLSRVTFNYVSAYGENSVADGLRALEQAAAAATLTEEAEIPSALIAKIAETARRVSETPEAMLEGLIDAADQGKIARWAEQLGLNQPPLSIERPGLYGEDPSVDEMIRPTLHQIVALLGEYSPIKWGKLVDVLVNLAQFVQSVRDSPPPYLLCTEDGGLGQDASELNLQDDLFQWLRRQFGRGALYERSKTGGGRPDTGAMFAEAMFPIEVKREFGSIDAQHMRESYIVQADAYATAADHVCFLVILDLRSRNAESHRQQARTRRKTGGVSTPVALYSLRDSFRVESVPADPDIANATTKVVIVGIVPGNRPLPSSTSTYSRRPRSGSRRSKATREKSDSK